MKNRQRSKRKIIILSTLCAILLAILIFCVVYVNDYYRASEILLNMYDTPSVTVSELDDGSVLVSPEGPTAGLVFYPGGKVEHTAYIPLMRLCASRGIACVIVKMPFNLAVLDYKKADDIIGSIEGVSNWYIAGHSLGGSMASKYAEENTDKVKGVILLASYSTSDLSDTGLDIISIYGSCDGVLNTEKYDQSRKNLPNDFKEHIIDGANHAQFGVYGKQDGDGEALISCDAQHTITAELICDHIIK